MGLPKITRGTFGVPHNQVKTEKCDVYFGVTAAAPGIAFCYWLPGVTGSPNHMALKSLCGH